MKDVKRYRVSSLHDWSGALYMYAARVEVVHTSDYDEALSKLAAETLRADTAEADLRTERLRADAAVGDANDAERELAAAEKRVSELEKDASRWNAFINCARIKFFGWAGYEEKDPYGNSPGNYRHFGGDFWSMHTAPTADKEKAKSILNGFADAAIRAALNPKPEAGSHEN